jgi:integrase
LTKAPTRAKRSATGSPKPKPSAPKPKPSADRLERIAAPAMEAWQKYIEARRPIWSARHLLEHETVSKEGGEHRTQGRRPGESDKTLPGILRPLLPFLWNRSTLTGYASGSRTKRAPPDLCPPCLRPAARLPELVLDRPEYRDQVQADACITRMARDELPKKAAKDDCLQREQLPAWFAAVRQIQNPVIAAYLQTALLTGARREEVAGIRWEDVDFQWKSMTIKRQG